MGHVFISYVREDGEVVERLARALNARGIETWLDREQLKPGQYWADAIRRAIQAGAFYIACFSRQSVQRTNSYMDEELALAIEELRQRPYEHGWCIPVVLDGTNVPDRSINARTTLRSLEWVDLSTGWETGIARLVLAIDPEAKYLADIELTLEARSARVRIAGLDRAAEMGASAAQLKSKVIEQLQHENETVRRAAVGALVSIAEPTSDVIRALLALIATSSRDHELVGGRFPYDAHAAARCLAALGARALAEILGCAAAEPALLDAVFLVLDALTDVETAPLLIGALSHADPGIRARAANALGRIFGPDDFPDCLNDHLPIDAGSRRHDARLVSLDVVSTLGKALLDSEVWVRANAASALGKIGPRSAAVLEPLLRCLDDPLDTVSGAAARALPHVCAVPTRAVPRLIELLGDTHYAAMGAAFALSSLSRTGGGPH